MSWSRGPFTQCWTFLLQLYRLEWWYSPSKQPIITGQGGEKRKDDRKTNGFQGLDFPVSYLLIFPCKQGAFQKKEIFPPVCPTSHKKVCMTQCYFCRRLALDASTTKPPMPVCWSDSLMLNWWILTVAMAQTPWPVTLMYKASIVRPTVPKWLWTTSQSQSRAKVFDNLMNNLLKLCIFQAKSCEFRDRNNTHN